MSYIPKLGDKVLLQFTREKPFEATIVCAGGGRFKFQRASTGVPSRFFWRMDEFASVVKIKEKEMTKSIIGLKTGDVITDDYTTREVVGWSYITVGNDELKIFILKDEDDGDLMAYTLEELQDEEYHIKVEAKEMTVGEVEEELGYKVKIVEG